MNHLIPAYRQKFKLCKPAVRTSNMWTSEAVETLRPCLDCTDWDTFKAATKCLDKHTEAVTTSICLCKDCCIPAHTRGWTREPPLLYCTHDHPRSDPQNGSC